MMQGIAAKGSRSRGRMGTLPARRDESRAPKLWPVLAGNDPGRPPPITPGGVGGAIQMESRKHARKFCQRGSVPDR
jgi:hypothetical protein